MDTSPALEHLGFRVVQDFPRPGLDILDAFQQCPTTDLASIVGRLFTMSTAIRPLYRPIRRVAGTALTVKVPPGDSLMVHAALDYLKEGDVLVVDAGGDEEYCLGGGLMCAIAQRRGARGFVLDGVYRDADEMRSIDFPAFGRGLFPRPAQKVGPGEINTTVQCGGVIVNPGDIVVADGEGAVVVPAAYAQVVLAASQALHEKDAGRWRDVPGWDRDHSAIFSRKVKELGALIE